MIRLNIILLSGLSVLIAGCTQQSAPKHLAIQNPPEIEIAFSESLSKEQNLLSSQPSPLTLATEKKKIQPATIWQRLINLYTLPDIDHHRIDRQLHWYLAHPTYLSRIQQRAEPYLFFILEEIEKQKVPGEIALLPAIESAFKPEAYSRSHAAGLWQFIPSTGRFFGLKQTDWYDGRRDIVASTQAAVHYLKQLSQEFNGDWLMALASYNAGKGNIRKAIRKNKRKNRATDFWSLSLRKETMDYVPRLLAIAKIFANPDKYPIKLADIPNKPYFEIIEVDSQIDLNKAAELAQLSVEEFLRLNPAFNRWSTAPNGPHRLLVPKHKADIFKKNLAGLPKSLRLKWIRHTVKPGESLSFIAKKYHTSIDTIKKHNQLTRHRLIAGKQLKIPQSERPRNVAGLTNTFFYTVKKGDSFWKIARRFSVSQRNLARWNQLSLKQSLRPGQKLRIKSQRNYSLSRKQHYTVKKGDSLFLISKKFSVSISDLKRWNAQATSRYLYPGQRLKVFN
jgi:membrane-bound lytic murein transglycosylase D